MAETYLPSTEAAMAVKARLTAAKTATRTRERSSRHSQIYEWHCLKDESCELPEERPEILDRFLVDLMLVERSRLCLHDERQPKSTTRFLAKSSSV